MKMSVEKISIYASVYYNKQTVPIVSVKCIIFILKTKFIRSEAGTTIKRKRESSKSNAFQENAAFV